MKITIPGDPIAKARARVTKAGFAYDPQWDIKQRVCLYLKNSVREFYEKSENRIEGHKIAIGESFIVDWTFFMPIPKSFNQSKKNACQWGFIEHITKPDLSNLVKFYEDCANGILWPDDSQIFSCQIKKEYSIHPRIEIDMTTHSSEHKKDVQDILSSFSLDEIEEIATEAKYLSIGNPINYPDIAKFLSKIADKHSKKFTKIAKKYPEHWKKFD